MNKREKGMSLGKLIFSDAGRQKGTYFLGRVGGGWVWGGGVVGFEGGGGGVGGWEGGSLSKILGNPPSKKQINPSGLESPTGINLSTGPLHRGRPP